METQKIVNLLNGSDNENPKFSTKKCYIVDSEAKGNYSHENPIKFLTKKCYIVDSEAKGNYSHENPIKFLTNSSEPTLCDYSDAYI